MQAVEPPRASFQEDWKRFRALLLLYGRAAWLLRRLSFCSFLLKIRYLGKVVNGLIQHPVYGVTAAQEACRSTKTNQEQQK